MLVYQRVVSFLYVAVETDAFLPIRDLETLPHWAADSDSWNAASNWWDQHGKKNRPEPSVLVVHHLIQCIEGIWLWLISSNFIKFPFQFRLTMFDMLHHQPIGFVKSPLSSQCRICRMPCPGSEPLGMTRRSGAQGLSETKIEGNQPTKRNVNVNGCILDMYIYIWDIWYIHYIYIYIIQYHIYIYIYI